MNKVVTVKHVLEANLQPPWDVFSLFALFDKGGRLEAVMDDGSQWAVEGSKLFFPSGLDEEFKTQTECFAAFCRHVGLQ